MKKTYFLLSIFFSIIHLNASRSLPFVKYQVENGLSHNTVWCVLQDSYDFMWFGTSDGLNCFDGKSFRIFRSNSMDKKSIGNNYIQSLYEDDHHDLWIGTSKGLYRFERKTETFSHFDLKTEDGVLISSNVSKVIKTITGDIWIATLGQGIFIYNPKNRTLVQNSSYSSFVVNLLQTPNGNVLATSRQEGLICFNKSGKYLRSYLPAGTANGLNNIEITALCYQNHAVWFNVGTYGFYKLDLATGQMKAITGDFNTPMVSNVRKIFSYSPTQLWVGGDNGLYLFDIITERFSRLDDPANPRSLNDQSICDIARDREGGIWVSTYFGGINYLSRNLKPFEHFYPQYQAGSISGKAISQFCEDPAGNLWIATEDGGLNYLNTKTQTAVVYKPGSAGNSISYHNIHSLLLDNDKLWIGTFSRGVDILDLKTKRFRNYQHRRDDSRTVCDNAIYAIQKDTHGDIYIGTAWGLCKYDRASDSFSMVEELGTMVHVFYMLVDSRGNLWVATYNAGVFRLDKNTKHWSHFTHIADNAQSITSNSVISIFEDKKHIVWFGTEGGGMCSFDYHSGKFNAFDPENKLLPNPVIYSIQQDEFDNFWIATNAGLIRINPYTKNNRLVFTKADGLQSNQFNFRSSLRAHDGKMYFGGINGFNAFYPRYFNQNRYVPQVRIVDFRLFNKRVGVNEEGSPLKAPVYDLDQLTLRYDQNTFSVTFAALSYQAPGKNQYMYMLEGVDKNWNVVDNGNNTASYTNLAPGKYVLRIKGSNNDGTWNEKETRLSIRIRPPFWASGFAWGFYLILLMVGAYWIYRNWLDRINRANEERNKAFREKQERDIYLSKINFFTNISHEIRTPLSLIKVPLEQIISSGDGNEKTKGFLSTINKNTDYLLNLINQLLDFRKTEEVEYQLHILPVNINALLQDIYSRFRHTAELQNIQMEIGLPDDELISGVDSDAFNKILSNLLSNALKYSKSHIRISLESAPHHFEVKISDDGKGISEKEMKKIFDIFYQAENSAMGTGIGLALSKALVEKHNGTLTCERNGTGGSTFIISMPVVQPESTTVVSPNRDLVADDVEYKKHLQKDGSSDSNLNNCKVLLVEDNEELLALTTGYLKDYYQILTASNGREALQVLTDQNIDLVVSDIMMPEMDGYQLCEAIKNDAQNSHIPVILLTAKTNVEAKIEGLECGADAYLEKPFSLEHLRIQIENLLASRKKLRELFASSPLSSVEIAVSKKDQAFIDKLNNEIEKHLLDVNFSIDTLSDFMNMSRSNFYRKIKSISGMSPNDYLKTIRLKKAAELLLSQNYRINEVYELAGFSSSSYFAKCFKEQFGMLPREFVTKATKGNNPQSSSDDEED